jgi:hypothetical protein
MKIARMAVLLYYFGDLISIFYETRLIRVSNITVRTPDGRLLLKSMRPFISQERNDTFELFFPINPFQI